MGATSFLPWPYAGIVNRKGVTGFTHRMLIGAAGAITGQDADSRVVATKQGTAGQYILQLPRGMKRITGISATFIGNTGSVVADWQTDNISSVPIPGGTIGTPSLAQLTLQFRNSAGTATDVASGAVVIIDLEFEVGV